jgi:hypothetical protein
MTDESNLEPTISAAEREALTLLGERLERERPVPSAGFRGQLRRRLMTDSIRSSARLPFRLWAASYMGAGAACLVVAAIGLIGAGPFAT